MNKLATFILVVLLCTGCGNSPGKFVLNDDFWVLESVGEANDSLAEYNGCSLEFTADGQLRGYTPCNMFFGSYTTAGSKISISVQGVTMAPCEHQTEQGNYLRELGRSAKYAIKPGKHLILSDSVGKTIFTFGLSGQVSKK